MCLHTLLTHRSAIDESDIDLHSGALFRFSCRSRSRFSHHTFFRSLKGDDELGKKREKKKLAALINQELKKFCRNDCYEEDYEECPKNYEYLFKYCPLATNRKKRLEKELKRLKG